MNKVLIIAEAGVNHNGDVETAKRLIDIASSAGADYVKFQTFKSESLVTIDAKQAAYQTEKDPHLNQLEMLKKLELSYESHFELIEYANSRSIKFLSTAFDLESVDFLKTLNFGIWKIPSGEITNYPYIKKIGSYNENVILSTGMSNLNEIQEAVDLLVRSGTDKEKITVLHCNTEYPTPMEDVNLLAMRAIKDKVGVDIGYSDHTAGIEVSIGAVALGATVIEKHFTLDKNMAGPDHSASLNPDELKMMVKGIRNMEKALGSRQKVPTESEKKNITHVRKSIVAAKNIKNGEVLTSENLTTKRPAIGLSPMNWETVVGGVASRDYLVDELIESDQS